MTPEFDLTKIKANLMQQHKELNKTLEAFTKGNFQDKLRDAMFDNSKESEKRTKINKKPAQMILMKTGDVVLKFDNIEDGKKFFDGK